jgi:toxin ParE1/3/4
MRLRFTPRAITDLTEIAEHIRADNPAAAIRVRNAIVETIGLILEFPSIGRAQNIAGVRKAIVRKLPFLIYYLVDTQSGEIVVLTIRHAARDPFSRND